LLPLCNRIASHSLSNLIASALQSHRVCCTIASASCLLCNCIAFDFQLHRVRFPIASHLLSNRIAFALQSHRVHFAIASLKFFNRIAFALQSHRVYFTIVSHSVDPLFVASRIHLTFALHPPRVRVANFGLQSLSPLTPFLTTRTPLPLRIFFPSFSSSS
jgi:hypothetical protein